MGVKGLGFRDTQKHGDSNGRDNGKLSGNVHLGFRDPECAGHMGDPGA